MHAKSVVWLRKWKITRPRSVVTEVIPLAQGIILKLQWTLSNTLLTTLIIALLIPYLIALVPRQLNPLTGFSVTETEVQTWLREIDPEVEVSMGGILPDGGNSIESDLEYWVTLKTEDSAKLFEHLLERIHEKVESGPWSITELKSLGESFLLVFHNGFSRYRVYVYNVPLRTTEKDYQESSGEKVQIVKIITIGYSSR